MNNGNRISKNARRRANRRNNPQQPKPGATTINIRPAASVPRRQNAPRRRVGTNSNPGFLSTVGGAVGSLFGPTGAVIGSGIGSGISRIFGSGDYLLSNPVAQNSLAGATPPMFGGNSGSTRVRHREFVGDILSSTTFSVRSYPLAPGLATLFPWLSRMAANYEQYRFRGLVVEFKSTSASALNSTNTALGVVGLATQYDAAEPDFQNKQEAENYIGAQSTNPSQSILHFVECAQGQNPMNLLYTRSGILPANQDIKFYDMGKVQLFTQGMQQGNVTIGELWVSYDIEFMKPKVPSGGDNQIAPMDWYNNTSVGYQNIYLSGKIAGVQDPPSWGNLGTYLLNNTIVFPPAVPRGRYMILIQGHLISGNATSSAIATATSTLSNCTAALTMQETTGTYIDIRYTPVSTQRPYYMQTIDIVNSGIASVALNGFDLSGTNNSQFNLTIYVAAIKNNDITPQSSAILNVREALRGYGIDLELLRKFTTALHDKEIEDGHLTVVPEEGKEEEEEPPRNSYDQL